jgi:large subunit ribosomal protein L9
MKVILLERVGKLGGIGDEVNVRNGFARNFLLPQGRALRATEANRSHFEADRSAIEQRNAERRAEAAGIASGLNGKSVVIIRQAGENGQLYGSVSTRDISDALAADGFDVPRSKVDLASPIKAVGLHRIALSLHPEVEVSIDVNVARSDEEAERQSKGEDLTVVSYEEETEEVVLQEVFEEGAVPDEAELTGETEEAEEASAAEESEAEAIAEDTEKQEDA